jgi:flavin-dependent dehydrogenase
MREQVIVGAGLSGLVAAVNLAREGYDVLVRERRDSVGGSPGLEGPGGEPVRIGDGTPIDLERLRAYTGIDISPAAVPLKGVTVHAYGRTFTVTFQGDIEAYLVERGPRPTSLDFHLFEMAQAEGVRFRFDDSVEDFDSLPPDSIICTGFFTEAFKGLGVPYVPVYGYMSMAEIEDKSARVIIYFDEYTRDYAFYSQVNGVSGAVMFSRGEPLDAYVKERFRKQLEENDGIVFDEWTTANIGALPIKQRDNPRLFAKNYILAGSLSGTIDPLLLFGVHGALVTGKVAAVAVRDHQRGLEEFKRINKHYRQGFLLSRAYHCAPLWFLKRFTWMGLDLQSALSGTARESMFRLIPGYGRL